MSTRLHYLFDPLCGWCYGASAAVAALANTQGVSLHMLPTGLFAEAGARPMTAEFADYAWANDQRIERLTGQAFSELYRTQVLADRQRLFDSGPATVALTAVAETAPAQEWVALKAIQQARYIDGQDTTAIETLIRILNGLQLHDAARLLQACPSTLLQANRARTHQAQSLMQTLGARGVPTFVVEVNGQYQLLPSTGAYNDPQGFAAHVATLSQAPLHHRQQEGTLS